MPRLPLPCPFDIAGNLPKLRCSAGFQEAGLEGLKLYGMVNAPLHCFPSTFCMYLSHLCLFRRAAWRASNSTAWWGVPLLFVLRLRSILPLPPQEGGLEGLKLYGMVGVPGEGEEDVDATIAMMQQLKKAAPKLRWEQWERLCSPLLPCFAKPCMSHQCGPAVGCSMHAPNTRPRSRCFVPAPCRLTLGCSTFVPKAHTPFQWYGVSGGEQRLFCLACMCRAVPCFGVLCCAMLCCTVLCCAVPCRGCTCFHLFCAEGEARRLSVRCCGAVHHACFGG